MVHCRTKLSVSETRGWPACAPATLRTESRLLDEWVGLCSTPLPAHRRLKTWIANGVPVAAARNAPPGLRWSPPPITTKRNRNRQTTNAPCLVFVSTVTLPCSRDLDCFQLYLSSITYWLKSPLCQRGLRFAVPPHLASADRPDGAFANSACEYSRCNLQLLSWREPAP